MSDNNDVRRAIEALVERVLTYAESRHIIESAEGWHPDAEPELRLRALVNLGRGVQEARAEVSGLRQSKARIRAHLARVSAELAEVTKEVGRG